MIDGLTAERGVCAALLVVSAGVFAAAPRERVARVVWGIILVAALGNAALLSLDSRNLINNNNVQQYLGAKYVFPYARFQEVLNAAREHPQVNMRDLENPRRILRADERAKRAYYIDLLRASGQRFDALAFTDSLEFLCRNTGALRREADQILSSAIAPGRVEEFRRDVRVAESHTRWADMTTDYGFNGSPFYALVRQLDPTLHRPFSTSAAVLGLAWQALSVLIVVWMLRLTFALHASQCLAAAALVFASWDFTGYALPGLTFAGLWIPVAAAALAVRHGRQGIAGCAIAGAGLMKLFPFILLLPSAVALLARTPGAGARRRAILLIGSCAVATAVLAFASGLGGRSWLDFTTKIQRQFGWDWTLANSVTPGHLLLLLGVDNWMPGLLLSVVVLGVLAAACMPISPADPVSEARRYWILAACTGLVAHTWFNYYFVAPLFLMPLLAPARARAIAASALLLATAYALPDFDDADARLRLVKLVPYLIVPGWLLAMELRERALRRSWRLALASAVAAAVIVASMAALRAHRFRGALAEADALLDAGNAAKAASAYARALELRRNDGVTEMNLGIAIASGGNLQAAGAHFARAASLDPDDPIILQNYGLWLRRVENRDDAAAQFERLRDLEPWNDGAWTELAAIRLEQGSPAEAHALASRGLELNPRNMRARGLLGHPTLGR